MLQQTIKNPVSFSGIGIHSGQNAEIILKPAAEDSGINFYRTDLPDSPPIPGLISQVSCNARSTVLGEEPNQVKTVEHLMAAAWAGGIDNLKVEIQGPELPIFDGSAAQYVQFLRKAGITEQSKPRRILQLKAPIWFSHNDSLMIALPHDKLEILCTINFPHPLVKSQYFDYQLETDSFTHEIAGCRTFGFIEEVQALLDKKLALGGSLENAIVIFPDHYSSPLHFPNELVRHKILDIIGDIYLLGHPLMAKIIAIKPSHFVNHAFIREIVKSKEAARC